MANDYDIMMKRIITICEDIGVVEAYLPAAVGRPQSPAGSLMGYRLG